MTEPDTELITDCEMTMATGPDNTDAAMGVTLAGRDRFHRGSRQAEPAEPMEPAGPMEPVGPVDQAESVVEPVEPVEPVAPVAPVDQAGPVVEPVDPLRTGPRPRPARTATTSARVMISARVPAWRSTGTRPTAAVRPGPTTPPPVTTS
jgi:hypothetical protein